MYLLDTNVISELRRPKPHGAVVAWLQNVQDRDLHISAVTIGEIQAGIEITRAQDTEKARQLPFWKAISTTRWTDSWRRKMTNNCLRG